MNILDELASNRTMIGYDLVCKFVAASPVYRVTVKADVLETRKLPTVAEFVLRVIQAGLKSESELAQTLGLDLGYVRSALAYLNSNQLIHRAVMSDIPRSLFSITPKGNRVLEEAFSALYPDFFDFLLDGITGRISSSRGPSLKDYHDLRKSGCARFLPVSDSTRPTVQSLNQCLSEIKHVFAAGQDAGEQAPELIEIVDAVDVFLAYRLVNILAFRNRKNGRISIQAFDGYEELSECGEILTALERERGGVIPTEMLVKMDSIPDSDLRDKIADNVSQSIELSDKLAEISAHKEALEQISDEVHGEENVPLVTAKSQRISELESEVKLLKESVGDSKPVQDHEHRFYLKQVFSQAKHSVIIVSPWIKVGATDAEIIRLIREAVDRGVKIALLYGMPLRSGETADDYIDSEVEQEFKKIQKRGSKGSLHYEFSEDGTHAKVAICDDQFCIVTSFNWLSYRGDRGFRLELGTFSRNAQFIEDIRQAVMDKFSNLPQHYSNGKKDA